MKKQSRYIFITIIFLIFSLVSEAKEKKKRASALKSLVIQQGDEKGNDVRALRTEVLISRSENLAIQQVEKLIKKYRGMAVEADLQLRLAELFMRRSKTERFYELNRESEVIVSLAPKKIQNASSKKMVVKAIEIYDYIEKKYPDFDKIDEVVFNNAFAREQIGQVKEAESKYWRVIKSYSYSSLVPDCHLAIGEMSFKQKRFDHALDHFDAIKKYPDSRVYPYGLYKGAWTLYNLRKTELAMKGLEQVIDFGKMVEKEGLNARLDLRKEALSDMTLFYSEIYPAKEAYKYFIKQAKRDEVGDLILKLARIYERHSLYENKDVILRDYISDNSDNVIIPQIYDQLVWNYENMKDRNKAVLQLKEYSNICLATSRWSIQRNKEKMKTEIENCDNGFRSTAIKLAQKWLSTWEKNQDYNSFADVSEEAFSLYLENNKDIEKRDKARFSLAQLQFKRKKYRQSSENYELVGLSTKDSTLGHETRYGAILAMEKAVTDSKWSEKDETRFANLVKQYSTQHPTGQFHLDVEFKLGLIYYDKSKYKLAAPIFLSLGSKYTNSDKGTQAQDLYLDILNHNKDYSSLQSYSKQLMGNKKLDGNRVDKLQNIYEQAYFLEVQTQEESGKIRDAIAKYLKFVKENPNSKLAEKAGWNAVQLYFKLADLKGGADASFEFANQFPKSENANSALLKAAQAYENMGHLDKATDVLFKLSDTDTSNKWKWKALGADFLVLQAKISAAEYIYNQIKNSSEEKYKNHALLQLEKINKNTSTKKHEELLEEIIKANLQPQASLAKLYFVEKLFSAKNYSSAFTESMKVLSMNGDASSYAKSRARFIQAQILEDEFDRQSVKSQIDRFTTVFAIKTEKLEKAQTAYQSAIRYGDPKVAVEALVKLAKLYGKYVQTLKNMDLPSGLPETDVPAFRAEMDKLIFPMEEKGVETMAEALNQAKRLKLRDGTVTLVQQELDKLNMKAITEEEAELEVPDILVPQVIRKAVGS